MYYDFSGYANPDGTPKPEAPKVEKPKVFPERSCGACGYRFTPKAGKLPVECPNCYDDVFHENF